ncbi:hypothetical protein RUM43_005421 [Polyplax serrata]|uniref:Uncharacterized protein n=1 Tax=Polyplax serrata TaxID=468196 RepID=A0AAN8PB76_POLSC
MPEENSCVPHEMESPRAQWEKALDFDANPTGAFKPNDAFFLTFLPRKKRRKVQQRDSDKGKHKKTPLLPRV